MRTLTDILEGLLDGDIEKSFEKIDIKYISEFEKLWKNITWKPTPATWSENALVATSYDDAFDSFRRSVVGLSLLNKFKTTKKAALAAITERKDCTIIAYHGNPKVPGPTNRLFIANPYTYKLITLRPYWVYDTPKFKDVFFKTEKTAEKYGNHFMYWDMSDKGKSVYYELPTWVYDLIKDMLE